MKHYGDIKNINGSDLEPVDVIIGGSPCQNLSIAGNRQGLSGEQSSLFLEQIRIVKESRKCHGKPRFMLWENVPGALTSNNGEDFRRVLEETVRIKEESVSIPRPEKWANAGFIMGDGFSVAWRIHDAQYWGVPQRRRRIALVADFDGQCAGEILFEPKGLRGDSPESGTPWEGTAGEAENCTDTAVDGVKCLTPWDCQSKRVFDPDGAMSTYQAMGDGGANKDGDAAYTISSAHEHPVCIGNGQADIASHITEDVAQTLNCMHDQQAVMTYMSMQAIGEYRESDVASSCKQRDYKDATDLICAVDCRNGTENPDINGTLQSKPNGSMSLNLQNVVREYSIIRRLTPLEYERLQGYPDGWTDIGEWTDSKGKTHKASDTVRYKALGNSIALPFWHWLLNRFASYLPESPTMGSLFDGIGGFPLCWERIYGEGSAVWASEIEPFCIAVTERRFNAR